MTSEGLLLKGLRRAEVYTFTHLKDLIDHLPEYELRHVEYTNVLLEMLRTGPQHVETAVCKLALLYVEQFL